MLPSARSMVTGESVFGTSSSASKNSNVRSADASADCNELIIYDVLVSGSAAILRYWKTACAILESSRISGLTALVRKSASRDAVRRA